MESGWHGKNFYKILEVDENSNLETIKKSYRNLAKKYHPDSNNETSDTSEKFKEIAEAYAVLSDRSARAEYDFLRKNLQNQGSNYGRSDRAGSNFKGFRDFNIHDFYETQTNPLWQNLFTTSSHEQQTDIETEIELTLDEVISGATKIINIQVTVPCSKCLGSNIMCSNCKNTRQEIFKQKIKIRIPETTRSGSKIKISGKGYENPTTRTKGDLYLKIQVKPHPYYHFNSQNQLNVNIPVLFAEAALGCELEIPLLESLKKGNETSVHIKIPEGTADGTVFRVGNKSLLHKNNKIFYATIIITVPTKLSRSAKKTLKKYATEEGLGNPREQMLQSMGNFQQKNTEYSA